MDEQEFRDKYYEKVKDITAESLPDFIVEMMGESLEYGSVCCAVAASALAAAHAANEQPKGGLTGFQDGAVMWEFIQQWNYSSNKCGLKIVDYDNMLFPQYDHKFEKTITSGTWESLKKEAQKNIDKGSQAHDDVKQHWKSIVDGNIPFGYKVEKD